MFATTFLAHLKVRRNIIEYKTSILFFIGSLVDCYENLVIFPQHMYMIILHFYVESGKRFRVATILPAFNDSKIIGGS